MTAEPPSPATTFEIGGDNNEGEQHPTPGQTGRSEQDDASKVVVDPTTLDYITIEDAIEKVGMGPFQMKIMLAGGLCFCADSMEVLLLSFLAVVLEAQWHLSQDETAMIISSVFLGAMTGTLVLGPLGDKIGRKPVFTLTAAIIAVFGLLTAAANNLSTLIIIRFLAGFGVGGLTVPFDTLAEFVPTSHRGLNLVIMSVFWCFGTLITPIFAYMTLGTGAQTGAEDNSWRYFVILCALPCLVSTVYGVFIIPESPRWLLTKGRRKEAMDILRTAAAENGHNPDDIFHPGVTIIDEEEHGVDFKHLFHPDWRKTTIFLWIAWGGFAFSYYGCVQLITLVFASISEEGANISENGGLASADTSTSYSFDYGAILVSAASEMAGAAIILYTIERYGRIPTQAIAYVVGGSMCLILGFLAANQASRSSMIFVGFIARMSYSAGTAMTWISTAELLTTEIRTTGHSAANAIARLGGASSPFLVNYGTPFGVIGGVLCLVSCITAAAGCMLPETKGKALGNVVHQAKPHIEDVQPAAPTVEIT